MSEEGSPDPGPAPVHRPPPLPSSSPSTGNVVGGVFLIGCGLCLALAGGACTALLVAVMANTHSGSGGSALVMPVTILVAGIGAVILGIRLVTKRAGG
jgi:hypothetical protein